MALDCISGTRQEWNASDLEWKVAEGKLIRIEAKSAAYFQSWQQKGHSAISFDIAKKISWYADTNMYGKVPERVADVYMFFLVHPKEDKEKVNPLDLSQWSFYVLPTQRLNQVFNDQQSIALSRLESLHGPCFEFSEIKDRVLKAANWNPES